MKNNELIIESKGYNNSNELNSFPDYMKILSTNNFDNEYNYMSFKKAFSGNYIIEEYMDSKRLKVSWRLKFETPADKTMFLLRYD